MQELGDTSSSPCSHTHPASPEGCHELGLMLWFLINLTICMTVKNLANVTTVQCYQYYDSGLEGVSVLLPQIPQILNGNKGE